MKLGAMLIVVGALMFAAPAQAHVQRVSTKRGEAAIAAYAAQAGIQPGTASDCHHTGRHHRMVDCSVTIPIGVPGSFAQATIRAYHIPGYGLQIFLERVGAWHYTIPF